MAENEDLPADWSRNAAGQRRQIPPEFADASSLAGICARIEYENAVVARVTQQSAPPIFAEIIAAIRRLTSPHLDWLSEAEATTIAGRPVVYFRDRFPSWERAGIAQATSPRNRFYLRAAVLAVSTTDTASRPVLVYVIRNARSGHIKIGISLDPAARLAGLQTASAETLELVATFAGGVEVERELHERFAASRLSGEWFEASADIQAWIDTLEAKGEPT